jgi:hypothetical protein
MPGARCALSLACKVKRNSEIDEDSSFGGAAKRNILRGEWTGGIGLNCFNKSSFAHTCRSRACSGVQTKRKTPDVASLIRAALALRAGGQIACPSCWLRRARERRAQRVNNAVDDQAQELIAREVGIGLRDIGDEGSAKRYSGCERSQVLAASGTSLIWVSKSAADTAVSVCSLIYAPSMSEEARGSTCSKECSTGKQHWELCGGADCDGQGEDKSVKCWDPCDH